MQLYWAREIVKTGRELLMAALGDGHGRPKEL